MTLFEAAYDWICKLYHTRDLPKFPYVLSDEEKNDIKDYFFGMTDFYIACHTYDEVTIEIIDCDWWYSYTTNLIHHEYNKDMFHEFLEYQEQRMTEMYEVYRKENNKVRDKRYKEITDWRTFIQKKTNFSPIKHYKEWPPSISLSLFKEWCDKILYTK